MLPEIKHFPVNWVDGMKISSTDFIALENSVMETIRDARSLRLSQFEYGILPTNNPEVDNYPKLEFDYTKNELVLKECRAITPGGQRIEITEDNFRKKKFPARQPAVAVELRPGKFDIYISVDTAERLEAGEVAGNNPPRYSVVSPKYELSLKNHSGQAMLHSDFLKISEVEIADGRVNILTSTGGYIPACTSIQAVSSLQALHENFEERLKGFIQKYSNLVNKLGQSNNKSALEVKVLMEKLITPVVSSLTYYKHIIGNQPPVSMVVYFKDYFRYVKFQLDNNFQAKIINELKPDLIGLLSDFDRKEPDHSSILKILTAIMIVLDKLDVTLSEWVRHNYEEFPLDVTDLNKQTSTQPEAMSAVSQNNKKEQEKTTTRVF